MAWARTLADMAPKLKAADFLHGHNNSKPIGRNRAFSQRENNDNKNEADRWRVRAEVFEKKVADCEVGMIQHMMQDRINDSIEKFIRACKWSGYRIKLTL